MLSIKKKAFNIEYLFLTGSLNIEYLTTCIQELLFKKNIEIYDCS